MKKRAKKQMSLLELYGRITGQADVILDDSMTPTERQNEIEKSQVLSQLSKQAINIAKVVLSSDKMQGKHKRIDKLIG